MLDIETRIHLFGRKYTTSFFTTQIDSNQGIFDIVRRFVRQRDDASVPLKRPSPHCMVRNLLRVADNPSSPLLGCVRKMPRARERKCEVWDENLLKLLYSWNPKSALCHYNHVLRQDGLIFPSHGTTPLVVISSQGMNYCTKDKEVRIARGSRWSLLRGIFLGKRIKQVDRQSHLSSELRFHEYV